jgi:hypothetical protein
VEVGLQAHPSEAALVAQHEPPAVGEVQDEAVPAGGAPVLAGRPGTAREASRRIARLGVVDDDPAGHAEVQPQRRAVAGRVAPHGLAAAVRRGQLAADQRVRDLARRVRAAHERVAILDGDDAAAQCRPLDERTRALDLRQLGHRSSVVAGGAPARRGR